MGNMAKIELNEAQRRAVEHSSGPLLIIAGAGTGKTRVITQRIVRLVEKGVSPENILALTFSNKAAGEMAERTERMLGAKADDIWIGTFHSFCAELLRDHGLLAGLDPFFTVLTEAQQHLLLESHLDELELRRYALKGRANGLVTALLTAFSRAKDEMITSQEYLRFAAGKRDELEAAGGADDEAEEEVGCLEEVARAYELYDRVLSERGALDFGGLILATIRMLTDHPAILSRVRARFTHILVDEFQDTNFAQSVLVDLLVAEHGNVCVVGDDDQSIYRFRGASIKNILDFQTKHPEALVVKLTKNYRSGRRILDASHSVVSKNGARLEKRLSARHDDALVEAFVAASDEEEAGEVASRIEELVESGVEPREIAILLRSVKGQGADILKALEGRGIPHDLVDGALLAEEAEVRDAIAWLKVIDNPFDAESMARLLSAPPIRLDPIELCRLSHWARQSRRSLFEVAQNPSDVGGLDRDTGLRAQEVTGVIRRLAGKAHRVTAEQIVHEALNRSGYRAWLAARGPEAAVPLANLAQLERLAAEFTGFEKAGLRSFLDYVDMIRDAELREKGTQAKSGGVQVMTMHAAKGLEFEVVFMAGLGQSKIPGRRRPSAIEIPEALLKEQLPESDHREAHVAEERRLFYVAMTRARKRLLMSYALGEGERPAKASQFLTDCIDFGIELSRARPVTSQEGWNDEELPALSAASSYKDFLDINEDGGLSLSYSDLDCYRTCPMQFKLSRIYRIPGKPSPERSFGTLVHSVLEHFHRSCPREEASFERLAGLFEEAWQARRLGDGTRQRQFKQQALDGLRGYAEEFLRTEAVPTFFERDFNLRVGPHMLRGRVDRVDVLPGGGHELIDYKVGRTWDDRRVREDLQLSVYQMGAAEVWSIEPVQLSYYFILDNKRVSLRRCEEELEQARQMILEAAEGILSEDFEPREGYISCRYCDYTLVCPAKDR